MSINYKPFRISIVVLSSIAICLAVLYSNFAVGKAQKSSGDKLFVPNIPPGSAYRQTNFLSDIPGFAPLEDPLLVNPWGLAVRGTSPFWIANDGTSTTQLVRGDVGGAPVVLNPSPQTVNIPGGLPTGTVGNSTSDFQITPPGGGTPAASSFIFDSITGNLTAWNGASGTTAQTVASMPGHVWTGLAIGANSGGNRLYAADFANNHVDVFDGTFTATTVTGGFIDATIPAGYAPFNIQNLGGSLYVTYAKVGPDGRSENGNGFGFVRKFNTDGVRDLTFAINNGALDAPWGLTIAPASFGIFGGALLVGNFSDNGRISAFNPATGAFLGTLQDESGNSVVIDELWALQFGNGGNGGDVNTLYFTAGIGEEEHGLFGKLNPTTATATSLIQFATSSFAVDEAGGHVDFTVIRTGDTSSSASINYNTFDESQVGHASQKSDYEIAAGTLTFAPGETSKTFRILIVDDKFVEGDETIDLYLSNPAGAGVGLGDPHTAELEILDNDSTAPTTNVIDNPAFFVRQQYLDFYNREPDAGATASVNQLTACGFTLSCIGQTRVDVANSFFSSSEFQGTGSQVIRTFRAAFGPNRFGSVGDVLYGEFEISMQALLKDVAIPGGDAQLETNKQSFYNAFVLRPDFKSKYDALTNAQYVDTLIANTGTTFPPGFRDQLVMDLDTMAKTRAQALRTIAEQSTFIQNEAKRDIVQLGFFAFMRRDPDTASFNTMLNRLTALTFDPARDAVRLFILSPEYRQRFGSDTVPAGGLANHAPDAVDDVASTSADTPVSINVISNDTDIDGDFLTVASVTPGTGGTPSISADGRSVLFTPTSGFTGVATFQYTVTDNGTRLFPFTPIADPKTDTATVLIGVGVATPHVSIYGRLFAADGRTISRASVILTGPSGTAFSLTNGFGYYRFDDVIPGQTYTISVSSKIFHFTPRMVTVNDNLTDVDLVASP
jgi:uncharacterized protein (TIGR03118 family)